MLAWVSLVSLPISINSAQPAVAERSAVAQNDTWVVDTDQQWRSAGANLSEIELTAGGAKSNQAQSHYSSRIKRFDSQREPKSITFTQTNAWDNWTEIPNVGDPDMEDAPVFIPVKKGDYWLLGRKRKFKGPTNGGYHAWHSSDMKTWTHHGPVSGYRERWMTTAEYVDGTFYLYYDHPNDEDPHLILDRDLTDGKMGEDKGMVFNDPSHGSDCAIFRDEDGSFNLIYENWDPIDAKAHSWDSPLAGRVVSPDGIRDFKWVNNVVDKRTRPTGKVATYIHGTTKDVYEYEVHQPEQDAFGDWTAIKIGTQYYLFCDYDPVGKGIRVGRWTSDSLNKEFDFCGEFGKGHPDPTVGFAEGKFYLIQQRAKVDFVSPGPWVNGVEARAGVDVSGNGEIDKWTQWQVIKETYQQKEGFVRIVDRTPATLDTSALPKGFGFQFEYRTKQVDGQSVNVVMDKVQWDFANAKGAEQANKKPNKKKQVKAPVPTWTDAETAAKETPGFQFLGEYKKSDAGLQVVPAEGRYYVSIYQGGLPSDGWDGSQIEHMWIEADTIADHLVGFTKFDRASTLEFTTPPKDAIVLFDGTKNKHWKFATVKNGLLQAGAATKKKFKDFKLHFECMTPYKPSLPLSHPGRGNSGVFALGAYEVQVMDTFGLDPSPEAWKDTKLIKKPNTWCGSIYGIRPPSINACSPPLAWQTFDVEFTAAHFDGEAKTSDAVMTIHHNGVLVQDQVKLPSGTGGGPQGPRPEVATGPIYFQKHGNPVQYRNIWIQEK